MASSVSSATGSLRNSTGGGRTSFVDTSSQRLSIGSARLSLLPNKNAVPTLALPTPQFDSEELSARAATFTSDVNAAIQKIKTKIADNTEQWVQDTAEARETDREIREEMRIAIAQETALAKALNKEKEEANNMSKAVQQLTARSEDMEQLRASLIEQVAILRREVKAKREAKIAQKKALDEQVLKNKPELASFESVLAMRIVGVKEDQIGFVFTRISEQDWDREYTITVDVSQHEFAVEDCSPALPELQLLLRYLNETRDFYGFLKKVRKAFKDLAKK
ncbi:chromosome segregation protein Spc25-domain-containing protein [Gamsiella multidivaricata]|uniref:chromosome segregation protein Spc25-domain-containing protein n=1 Tax=Gamsiella multidivaricata TaxID=101098 RepID=UPI00221FBB50|nr:chromosome segregation protein Spc25-domain-containing protein [Gamsiella multidivaricata]KAI7824663.1 chromosome segregation protein Spc25-domain-containing protein [Gamsiella multidivaricata]